MPVELELYDRDASPATVNLDPTSNSSLVDARSGTELMRHRLFSTLNPDLLNQVQIIVPARLDGVLLTDRPKILWVHDLPTDPALSRLKDPTYASQFFIVCVSHWQHQQMLTTFPTLNPRAMLTIQNGIEPIPWNAQDKIDAFHKDGRVQLIYTPTPHRGLALLVAAVDALSKVRDDFDLHVCSSFDIYGKAWAGAAQQFKPVFDICEANPRITYHGTVTNDEVRKLLVQSHIFAYPSIYPETSCLAAIEALAAGCKVVTTPLAALPETCGQWANYMALGVDGDVLATLTYEVLNQLITATKTAYEQNTSPKWLDGFLIQAMYYNAYYHWNNSLGVWTALIQKLLQDAKGEIS